MIQKKRKSKSERKVLRKMAKLFFTIKIQRYFKKYLERIKLCDSLSTENRGNYINNTTFIGTELNNLNKLYFYRYKNHFFDIRELYKHIRNSDKNPYDNIKFSKFILRQIKRIYLRIQNNIGYLSLNDDYNEELSFDNIISSMKTNLFNTIDHNIGNSNFSKFNNLTHSELYDLMETLFNFNLINSLFDVEYEMYNLDNLYHRYKLEKRRNRNSLNTNEFLHKFNYAYGILNLLNEMISVNDGNKVTRCHIINETISIF
tara:strand:+ start:2056 stop:2832 length:777 start_codon:yes stop_codon:yes gene_type:complete